MAKQIKALKCPQCGSVKKELLKEDYFRCSSCGTEYFLDNDDININIRHQHNPQPFYPPKPINKKLLIGLFIAAGVLFVVLPIMLSIFSNTQHSTPRSTASTRNSSVRESIQEHFVLSGKDGHPVAVFKIQRRYHGRNANPPDYVLRFYDPIQEKTLKTIEMKDWTSDTRLYYHRFFSDGNFYVILKNELSIYKIDATQFTFTKVNHDFFDPIPEFSSGIASLEFRSASYGDGLEIMTNDGTQYFYYPMVKKVFKGRDALEKAYEKIAKDHSMPEKVHYTFTSKSTDYKEEKIQLIKFWYRERPGDLISIPSRPSWRKKYHYPKGSGIFVGNFKYDKVLFSGERVTNFEDITPDRLYFEPEIVYENGNELYISGFPTANTDGNKFLQKIDVNSGKVRWNYKPDLTEYSFHRGFYPFKNGVAFHVSGKKNGEYTNSLVFLGNDGQVIKEINLQNLFND